MKANRRFREEDGVSNVLGGILFFSLIFVFLVVVRVEYVPVWEEDREARQVGRLQEQMANLKSEADRQAGNKTAVPVANSITLAERTASRFFTPSITPGTITFTPGAAKATLSSDELLVVSRGANDFFPAVDETWVTITGPTDIDNIAEVLHLRLRVTDPSPTPCGGLSGPTGDSVTLTVTDANGDFAGDLTIYTVRHASGYSIKTEVRSASNETIFNQGESLFCGDSPPFWWTDALDPVLHFVDVLGTTTTPFTLTLSESGLDGEYTITYAQDDGTGQNIIGNAGRAIPDYEEVLRGGTLRVDTEFAYYHDQSYWLENGAMILQQGESAVMRIGPGIELQDIGAATRVRITVPALIGDADSLSHAGVISVITEPRTTKELIATAPMLNYTVQTQFPSVWEAWLRDTAEAADLSSVDGEFAITTTASSVTFTIWGQTATPSSTDHDLSVVLHPARVGVRLST